MGRNGTWEYRHKEMGGREMQEGKDMEHMYMYNQFTLL